MTNPKTSAKPSPRIAPFLAVALVLAAVVAALLAPASAALATDATDAVAYSMDDSGKKTYYATIEQARTAGYTGLTIYMNKDWEMSSTFEVADSKTLTIDMMGHKITTNERAQNILLNEHANLTLKSSVTTTFTYRPFSNEDGKRMDSTVNTITTGGLITEGLSSDDAGGIRMNNDSKLTLENVAVAGNEGDEAGGIYVKKNCTINMNAGSCVSNNRGKAGGIFFNQADCNLTMNNAKISQNYGSDYGGGICSDADGTRIVMNGGSTISENSGAYGGGIEFRKSFFTVRSDDGDRSSSVKDNIARSRGGGIYTCYVELQQEEGTVENITVSGNNSASSVGGIYVNQKYVRLINCSIVDNRSQGIGAGVWVAVGNCAISGCTITGNKITSGYYTEGAGIWVNAYHDVTLSGVTIIRDNTLANGEASDVYLEYFKGARAYILGGVDAGSSVGVCPTDGVIDRQVGKSITTYTYGTYFSDVADSCITYGSDGTLWCVSGAEGYLAKVNGVGTTRYKKGATITADGAPTDSTKHFWYWDADASTGLSPVSEYINDKNKYDQVLTYTMPNNDTDLKAAYVAYVGSGMAACGKPEVGKELSTEGSFYRTDGTGVKAAMPATVAWFTVGADGGMTPASGVAESGKTYVARVTVPENKQMGLFFSADAISADKVEVYHGGSGGDEAAASVAVDAATGSLTVTTVAYAMPKAEIESVDEASVSVQVGATRADVLKALPAAASARLSDGTVAQLETDLSGTLIWPEGMFDADGKVVMPADGAGYTMSLVLKASDKVASVDGHPLTVRIAVTDTETPAQPTVTPVASTYSAATEPKLGDDLTLKVTATCETEGASIRYRVDGGEAATYDADAGIVLKGEADKSAEVKLEVWAESAGGKSSPVYTGTYVLDDTLGKSITVNCSDTAFYAEGEQRWSATFAVTGDLGSSAAAVAPDQDGRVFDHWEWAGAPEGTDLASKVLTIPSFSLDLIGQIAAVYTPVISRIDLGADAPVAHEALTAYASHVKVGAGDGEATTDISSYLEGYVAGSGAPLAWTPESRDADGNAAHVTTYAASLSLKAGSSADGVKYLLADDVALTYNGNDVAGGAYIVSDKDGNKSLRIDFPSTGPYEAVSVDEPAEVEVTHAAATAGKLDLPKDALVRFACGEQAWVNIDWSEASGFDPGDYGEQELTATGTLAFSGDVDNEQVGSEVSVKVKVAAAETVAAPTATPEPGTYGEAQSVKLSCATDGATIFYTTDGSEPTDENGTEYEGDPIAVAATTTVKARAYLYGSAPSAVSTLDYVITAKTCDAPAATPEPGVYAEVQSVTLSCATGGATIYYTTDGSEPSASSARYDGPIAVPESATIKAFAAKDGMNASKVAEFTYVIQTPEPVARHTVTFDSKGGSAVESQTVADGEKATRPADPTRDGYSFKGWYTKSGEKYDFSAAVTSDLKLVAKWEKASEPVGRVQMLRLYNPYTGEHLYTSSTVERDACVAAGWNFEGNAWVAPSKSSAPVYRLYNPYVEGGDHFYTTDAAEVENLKAAGWSYEGVGWFSDDSQGVKIYRQYNPFAETGTHNYTSSTVEKDSLVALGWRDEQVAWYGMS